MLTSALADIPPEAITMDYRSSSDEFAQALQTDQRPSLPKILSLSASTSQTKHPSPKTGRLPVFLASCEI